MNKKLKLALAALLGFSTACTSVKNAPKESAEQQKQEADTAQVKIPPRVVVMYGVRMPRQDSLRRQQLERPDTLPPVAEQTREEDTPSPAKK